MESGTKDGARKPQPGFSLNHQNDQLPIPVQRRIPDKGNAFFPQDADLPAAQQEGSKMPFNRSLVVETLCAGIVSQPAAAYLSLTHPVH